MPSNVEKQSLFQTKGFTLLTSVYGIAKYSACHQRRKVIIISPSYNLRDLQQRLASYIGTTVARMLWE